MPSPTKAQKKWVSGQLQTPINGPGYTKKTLGKIETESNLFKRPDYDGSELRQYEGRPGANDHMQHGSVVNGKPVPYTPPRPVCVGAAGPMSMVHGQVRYAK